MFIVLLFFILTLLFAVESSTSLARLAGLSKNNLASGLQVQSGLSLISRALMACFMPMLGYFSDHAMLNNSEILGVIVFAGVIPAGLYITYVARRWIYLIYREMVKNLITRGSYFPLGLDGGGAENKGRKRVGRKVRLFRAITFFSYIPYYAAWPIIIMLLSRFPDNRGLIIGMSSIMNGVNTLAIVLFVDPFLIRAGRHLTLSRRLYVDQLWIRVMASMVAYFLFIMIVIFV